MTATKICAGRTWPASSRRARKQALRRAPQAHPPPATEPAPDRNGIAPAQHGGFTSIKVPTYAFPPLAECRKRFDEISCSTSRLETDPELTWSMGRSYRLRSPSCGRRGCIRGGGRLPASRRGRWGRGARRRQNFFDCEVVHYIEAIEVRFSSVVSLQGTMGGHSSYRTLLCRREQCRYSPVLSGVR
jgi:hypothetical protein